MFLLHAAGGDDDAHGEVGQWTIRRACAGLLDSLAEAYGDKILPILLPELQARLSARGDDEASWRAREVGVLALGAIASGCLDSMAEHAPSLWPLLIGLTSDAAPLVRSVSLWCLARYLPWLMELQLMEAEGDDDGGSGESGKFAEGLIGAIAGRMLDGNRKVQEAACAALLTTSQDAPDLVTPYVSRLVPVMSAALGRYGTASRISLYDAIGVLADSLKEALAKPEIVAALLPGLMARYAAVTRDVDPELPPLLECLTYLFISMGRALAEIAPPLFGRALNLIEHDVVLSLAAKAEADSDPSSTHKVPGADDMPLMAVSLDLLGGMIEGLGPSIAPLIASAGPRFHELLSECVKQPPPSVRMSAFALLGELAKHAPDALRHSLPAYVPWLLVSMRDTAHNIKACNNAVWAAGELAVALPDVIAPHVPAIVAKLAPIISNDRKPSRPVLENSAIALGRLAMAAPDSVAGALSTFMAAWTQNLTIVGDPEERRQAYLGYCAAVGRAPAAGLALIPHVIVAFAVFQDAPPDAKGAMTAILQAYRANAPQQWREGCAKLSHTALQKAAELYGRIFP